MVVSNSKFKQPMKYTPVSEPVPSKIEQWKNELGLSDSIDGDVFLTSEEDSFTEADQKQSEDKKSVLELGVLKAELKKKDKQKDELMQMLKTSNHELKDCQSKLRKVEGMSKSKLKIMKKSYETQLNEKTRLIKILEGLISGFELKHCKDGDTQFDFATSVKGFLSEIEILHNEKQKLMADSFEIEQKHFDVCEELKITKAQVESESISRVEEIKKENSKVTCEKLIDELRFKINSLQKTIVDKESNHVDEVKTLDIDNKLLKKKLSQLESKMLGLTPKTDIKSVGESTDVLLMNKMNEFQLLAKEKEESHLEQMMKKDAEFNALHQEFHERESSLKKDIVEQVQRTTLFVEEKFKSQMSVFANIVKYMADLNHQLKLLKAEKEDLKVQLQSFIAVVKGSFNEIKSKFIEKVVEASKENQLLVQQYHREIIRRKKLHNKLVELKGNIRVFCRVRPIINEDGTDCKNVVWSHPDDDTLVNVEYKSMRSFEMDRVFDSNSSQVKIFDEVKSLVTSCLDGYNICIFAYGQTGSGKTFTMEGTTCQPGINRQALNLLFHNIEAQVDWKYSISVCFMEIYNEMLRDLLSSEPTSKLDIKQNKDGGVHVPGLTYTNVVNVEDVKKVFDLGCRNRMTAATDMNERSSRSHAVFIVRVVGRNVNTNATVIGNLNLVDLAGSERVSKSCSQGVRLKEAQCINKSLSALSDVIHSLRVKAQHVPYRNTKLTYLLQDSLGGNSKTLMLVQISPTDKNASETVCSLNFAQRIREVALGQATRKVKKS